MDKLGSLRTQSRTYQNPLTPAGTGGKLGGFSMITPLTEKQPFMDARSEASGATFTGYSTMITPMTERNSRKDSFAMDIGDIASIGHGNDSSGDYFGLGNSQQLDGGMHHQQLFAGSPSESKKRQRRTISFNSNRVDEISEDWHGKYMELKREVGKLEHQLEELAEKSQRKEKFFERELRLERNKLEKKESEVVQANQQEEEYRLKLKQMEIARVQEKHQLTDQVSKHEKNIRKLHAKIEELTHIYQAQITELNNELEYARRLVEDRETTNSRLQEEMEIERSKNEKAANNLDLARHVEELMGKIHSLEREKKDLAMEKDALKHGAALEGRANTLMKELAASERRERELRASLQRAEKEILSQRESNIKVEAMEKKVAKQATQLQSFVAVESERDALLAERNEWTNVFRKIVDVSRIQGPSSNVNPLQVLSVLAELENECATLNAQKSELSIKLSDLKTKVEREQSNAKDSQTKLLKVDQAKSQLQERVADLEKTNLFLSKERDSYLRIVQSVRDEGYATLPKAQQQEKAIKELQERHKEEVEIFKENLAAAHSRISELESTLSDNQRQGLSPALLRTKSTQLSEMEAQVRALESENKKLASALDKAQDEIVKLQSQINAGMYNPQRTKILHLAHNPQSRAFGHLASTNNEDQQMDSGSSRQDSDKGRERLKQLFKEKTRLFKEAVYLLTGFKVDMMDKERRPQLRLRSMYAEKPDDDLLFQWKSDVEGGGLELLETPFCNELDENTFAYLTRCNSVPAFLSTLTLDLFSKQTLAIN